MYQLVVGNKTYSSWSLRAWILLTQKDIPFKEIPLNFASPTFQADVAKYSPSRRVPALIHSDLTVWDSLSIAEYIAEQFPDREIWPKDATLRALARSACAEMHSGFGALRQAMPMNVTASLPGMGWSTLVQRDVDRIVELWAALSEAARIRAAEGNFLCGEFGAVDAFYAPIASRMKTYGVKLPALASSYVDAIHESRAMRTWIAGAQAETDFIVDDEPYRVSR